MVSQQQYRRIQMKPVPALLHCRRLGVPTFLGYLVLALAGCGGSGGPPPDTTPPTVPTSLAATAASSTQINLTWTASTDDVAVTGYKVERCQGASCTTFAQIAAPSGTTFNDTGLSASTSYSYRVLAADAAGNISASSTVVTALTLPNVAVSLSPKRGGLTVGQALTLTAALTNDTRVTWASSSGGSLSGQTNTPNSFSPAAARVYTIHG